jgi:hypothetical protein
MSKSLMKRLDRVDPDDGLDLDADRMTDAQLHRVIALGMPDPAEWLARWNATTPDEQDAELLRIRAGEYPKGAVLPGRFYENR